MITKNMARFMGRFQNEMEKYGDVETAIEMSCGYDLRFVEDYD